MAAEVDVASADDLAAFAERRRRASAAPTS